MTVDDISNRVLFNLDSSGIDFFTTAQVLEAIKDGQHEVTSIIQPFDGTYTLALIANTPYYDLYNLIGDYITVFAIHDEVNDRWLDFLDLERFDLIDSCWETTTGRPECFAIVNFRYIAISKVPSISTETLTVYYRRLPKDLDSASTLKFLNMQSDILEWYATADLLERSEEFIKAKAYRNLYVEALQQGGRLSNARDSKDRIIQLWQQF